MTGVYEIRPAQWWDWTLDGYVKAMASIPAVTTRPASDDPQAVTVRFSYPGPAMCRGGFYPVAAIEGESFEWRSGFAMMGPDGVRIHGDTPNSGEKADTASGFVSGSCPDRPASPKAPKLFLNVLGNMFEEKE